MFSTHDPIEEGKCYNCKAIIPYYALIEMYVKDQWVKQTWCEYCLDELYQPETI